MRKVAWLAALVSLMACNKDKERGGGAGTATPPAVLDAAAVAPVAKVVDAAPAVDLGTEALTPAVGRGVQVMDLQYGGFAAPGLPAIRDDGSELAAVALADDGGRGYLDLQLVFVDGGTDKVKTTMVLANPEETSEAERASDQAGSLEPEEALHGKVRERVAKANAVLASGWRSLVTTELDDAATPGPRQSLTVGELTFTYEAGRLNVVRDGQVAGLHDLRALVQRPAPRADQPCPGDVTFLQAVHVDETTRKVLVELGAYEQGHNCGTDGPTFTVVPLPL